ncbi:MAG TPA: hypothetical protein HPP56_02600 [Nitrospirae bacterium]|nr:hypothetical protein [Nitrospirota bacterium]
MLKNNGGFALMMALLSLLLVSIIGVTGLNIVTTNLQTTQADESLNLAEKSANAGILRAVDEVNKTGICTDQQLQGNLGNAQYTANINRSGRICFIKSEGKSGNAKAIKTSIIQSFYGLGLYTVRGNVNANLSGSTVRLSGCDTTVTPTCFLPAFIASGAVNTTLQSRQCSQDSQSAGLYGNPAIYPNVIFNDLIPLFFNVDCFNTHSSQNCGLGLLQVFENEYGRNPDITYANDVNKNYDMRFNNGWGIPTLNRNNIPSSLPLTNPTVPVDATCTTTTTITTLDLSNQFTSCNYIIIPTTGTNNLTISGNGLRGGTQRVRIYDQRNGGTRTVSTNTQNFILDIRTSGRSLTINSGANNFIVYNNGSTSITNSSNFYAFTSASTTITGDGNNNSSNNFVLYNTGTTTYQSLNNGKVKDFKHRSTNNVILNNNVVLENGTIIIAQNDTNDINNLNNPATSLNLISNGTFTMRNMNLFVRSMRFADNTVVNIFDSLIYLYTYACPNCSRASSDSSLNACATDNRWCGWVGNASGARFAINLGRGPNNEQWPVLIISNNTTLHTESLPGTAYIWGAFVGQDVTYLRWIGAPAQSFRGFLIRNFPPNLSLNINIGGNFTLEFRKSLIDQLSSKYWFFRKIDCIQDDMNPLTQKVQTGMSAY